jgi:NitT/TauT family transport system substrate-binding protein
VVKWLQQVSDFFMADAGEAHPISAAEYFDPAIYLSTI